MKMTVILSKIGFDRFSAVAVDIAQQKHVWDVRYDSLEDLIESLAQAGAVTSEEIEKLWDGSWFLEGAPILRVIANREDLERLGFVQMLPVDITYPKPSPYQV